MKKKHSILAGVICIIVILTAVLLVRGNIWMNRSAAPLPTAIKLDMISGRNLVTDDGYTYLEHYSLESSDEENTQIDIEKFAEVISSLEYSYCPEYYFKFLEPKRNCEPVWWVVYEGTIGDEEWYVQLFFDNELEYLEVRALNMSDFDDEDGFSGTFKVANMDEWREVFYEFLRDNEEFMVIDEYKQ